MLRIALSGMVGALLLASAQGHYVPTANEELYGNWINEKMHPQRIVVSLGPSETISIQDLRNVADESTLREVTQEVDRKWTDADGVVWYRTYDTITSGLGKGMRFQSLIKLSKSSQVLELVHHYAHKFDPESFPTVVEPSGEEYHIYYRAKE